MKPGSGEDVSRTYDAIAEKYRDSTELPTRVYVDRHTLLSLAGPLEGKTVLDLGCGEGHYTRLLKRADASAALGVDVSPEMIRLAEDLERAEPRTRYNHDQITTTGLRLLKTLREDEFAEAAK